ncbi:hypothetical protein [Alcaligenes aquatilis]|uniref:hypothetical protein n=1 Tax=Alcaligenes aquatilis TaxID=323284 RepID=UPI003F91B505
MSTKRSLNKCAQCSHTWYPRGKQLSVRCPECASKDVSYASNGFWWKTLATILFFGISIATCGKTNQPPKATSNEKQKALPLQSLTAEKLLNQQLESNKSMQTPSLKFELNKN